MKLLLNCTLEILTIVDSFTLQMILHKQIRAWTHLEAPRPLQTLPQRQRVPANVARTQSSHVRAFITVPLGQPVYWDRPTPTPVPLPTVHCYVTTTQVQCIYYIKRTQFLYKDK